jgi:hypothetical protein
MNKQPLACPNPGCENHLPGSANFFRKRGYYTPKSTGHKLARYECKACGKTFSNQTFSDDFRQHRQDINRMLPRLLCSGVTMRRSAWILECSYNTVRSRLPWLADKARAAHEAALASGDLDTSYIQFDEMQSFEHSAAKPLTIALAVRAKTGQILSAKVGRIPSHGHLAAKGKALYGWTKNESAKACLGALRQAGRVAKPDVTVACDKATPYPSYVAKALPKRLSPRVKAQAARGGAGGDFDPLFKLNHKCAVIRSDLACMARRTWATTKKRGRLQDRLDLFIAVHNGYAFG